jgi:hypothetical protein
VPGAQVFARVLVVKVQREDELIALPGRVQGTLPSDRNSTEQSESMCGESAQITMSQGGPSAKRMRRRNDRSSLIGYDSPPRPEVQAGDVAGFVTHARTRWGQGRGGSPRAVLVACEGHALGCVGDQAAGIRSSVGSKVP